MQLQEIRNAVLVWLMNRPEATTTLVDSIINKVYLSMAMPFRFHAIESEYLLSTVAGTKDYSLSSGDMYALHTAYDAYYGNALSVVDINQINTRLGYELEGAPIRIARFGAGVRLDPSPDYTEADAIVLRGLSLPARLVQDTDEPIYPEDWHWFIELQTASMLSFMLQMDERGQLLQNIALGQLTGRQEAHTLEAFTKQMHLIVGNPSRGKSGSVEIRGS